MVSLSRWKDLHDQLSQQFLPNLKSSIALFFSFKTGSNGSSQYTFGDGGF